MGTSGLFFGFFGTKCPLRNCGQPLLQAAAAEAPPHLPEGWLRMGETSPSKSGDKSCRAEGARHAEEPSIGSCPTAGGPLPCHWPHHSTSCWVPGSHLQESAPGPGGHSGHRWATAHWGSDRAQNFNKTGLSPAVCNILLNDSFIYLFLCV